MSEFTIEDLRKEMSNREYVHSRGIQYLHKIRTLDQLLAMTDEHLLKWPHFGRKSLNALNSILDREGLALAPTPIPKMSKLGSRLEARLGLIEEKLARILRLLEEGK